MSVEEQRGSSTRRFEAALVRVDLEPDEAWLLHERGRLRIGPAQILEAIAGRPGYGVLPLGLTVDPRSRKLKPSRARAVLLVGTRPPRR